MNEELNLWTSILLGILQGIGEFLPISSSGHLAMGQIILGIDPDSAGQYFNIALHLGTLMSVICVYRKELGELLWGLSNPRSAPEARPMFVAVVLATLPLAVPLSSRVSGMVEAAGQSATVIGSCWLLTAALLAFSHRRHPPEDDPIAAPAPRLALLIGLAQLAAVMPGVSRSGATIAAALALGMGRARAARFSFFISIPAIAGAGAKTLVDVLKDGTAAESQLDPQLFAVGFVVSFVVGLVVLKGLLAILQRVGLMPFVPYLVVIGVAALLAGQS